CESHAHSRNAKGYAVNAYLLPMGDTLPLLLSIAREMRKNRWDITGWMGIIASHLGVFAVPTCQVAVALGTVADRERARQRGGGRGVGPRIRSGTRTTRTHQRSAALCGRCGASGRGCPIR